MDKIEKVRIYESQRTDPNPIMVNFVSVGDKLNEIIDRINNESCIGTFKDNIMKSFTYHNLKSLCEENGIDITKDKIELLVPHIFKTGAMEVAKELNEKFNQDITVNIHTSNGKFLYLWGVTSGNKYAFSIGDNSTLA